MVIKCIRLCSVVHSTERVRSLLNTKGEQQMCEECQRIHKCACRGCTLNCIACLTYFWIQWDSQFLIRKQVKLEWDVDPINVPGCLIRMSVLIFFFPFYKYILVYKFILSLSLLLSVCIYIYIIHYLHSNIIIYYTP